MTKKIASLPAWAAFGLLIASALLDNYLPHPIGLVLMFAALLIWVYSLGSEAQQALPEELKLRHLKFKFALLYVAVYGVVSSMIFNEIMPYAIPFHFLAMFCMFYGLYFAAKAIRTVELNRTAKFEEWFAVFCGMWFFPIGVWFVQPKIRRIMKGAKHA